MIADKLNTMFGIPGAFTLQETAHGLVKAHISTAGGAAAIYLQGAHLTQWQPAGNLPVLFLSAKPLFARRGDTRGNSVGLSLVWPMKWRTAGWMTYGR